MQGLQVPHDELGVRDGSSPLEQFDNENGGSARRSFLVLPEYATEAVWQILGYPYKEGTGVEAKINRWLPEFHPLYPWMIATKVTAVRGIGWSGNQKVVTGWGTKKLNTFKKYQIDVQYDTPEYSVISDDDIRNTSKYPHGEFHRFVVVRMKPTAEMLTYPTASMHFTETHGFLNGAARNPKHSAIPGSVSKLLGKREITYSWREVPDAAVPWDDIFACIGKVNQKTFDNAAPHTMLCLPPDIRRIRSAFGTWMWHIDYHMVYQSWGQNRMFDFDTRTTPETSRKPDFFRVSIDGVDYPPGAANATGKRIFDEYDFAKLFKCRTT
jgi:hypothetical protein